MQNPSKNSKATYWSLVVPSVTSCLSLQSIWKCFKMFQDQREWLPYMLIALTWPPSCASAQSLTKRFPSAVVSEKVIISAISTFELSPYDMRQPSFAGQSTFANVWKYERAHLLIWYICTESLSTCWILILFSYIKKDLLSRIMPITLATLQGAALVALDRVRRAWRDLPCHVFTVRNLSRRGSPIKRKGKWYHML